MRRIPLTQGMSAMVDDSDHAWLSQWTWAASKARLASGLIVWRAVRSLLLVERDPGTTSRPMIKMHRAILRAGEGVLVDHRNGDGLDNQRHNLREATPRQNSQNRAPCPGKRSRFVGVTYEAGLRPSRRWVARIRVAPPGWIGPAPRIILGRFSTEAEAGEAYAAAARAAFGEFALNRRGA